MENLKELGLSINEELIQEANELEEEIIKKELHATHPSKIGIFVELIKFNVAINFNYLFALNPQTERYFPTQKCLKIFPSTSSVVISPVISPR